VVSVGNECRYNKFPFKIPLNPPFSKGEIDVGLLFQKERLMKAPFQSEEYPLFVKEGLGEI
jgi:hypothetical protein